MRSFTHPAIRRSILALAITQLVMSSLAPLHELGATSDRGVARVEQAPTSGGTPTHNPDTCALCRFVATPIVPAAASSGMAISAVMQSPAPAIAIGAPARSASSSHQTRAPPIALA